MPMPKCLGIPVMLIIVAAALWISFATFGGDSGLHVVYSMVMFVVLALVAMFVVRDLWDRGLEWLDSRDAKRRTRHFRAD